MCVKESIRLANTRTHGPRHTMQILVQAALDQATYLQDKQEGGTWQLCPGTQSQNPKLREKALLLLGKGSPTTPLPFPALSTMTGISRSHCVPLKQTSIPAPPHQSKYCRGYKKLKGSPHRAFCQRDTKVYRETGRRGTRFRYRGAGVGSGAGKSSQWEEH